MSTWEAGDIEKEFIEIAAAHRVKPGELMLPLRIMLVGKKFGPGVFEIAQMIGKEETIKRINHTLQIAIIKPKLQLGRLKQFF